MRPSIRAVLLILVTVTAPSRAAAQALAHVAFQAPVSCADRCDGRLVTFDPEAGRIQATAVIPGGSGLFFSGFYATPDGRSLLWAGPPAKDLAIHLAAFDTATQTSTLLFPMQSREFLGHPARPEIYAIDVQGPLIMSAAGIRRMANFDCGGAYPARSGSISADGTRVSFWCGGREAVFDTATGTLAGVRAGDGGSALARDGQSLYQLAFARPLRRVDVSTGAMLAQAAVGWREGWPVVDPRTGEVAVITNTGIDTFDGQTLALTRSARVPGLLGQMIAWTFDRFRPRAYVVTRNGAFPLIDRYYVIDTTDYTIIQVGEIDGSDTNPGKFAISYRPAPPTGVAATVAGGRVDLTWQPGPQEGAVTRYVVEVGSAPGLSDLATADTGMQTSLAASGAPPGRYYVRVRAVNYTGASAPSPEVVVQVTAAGQ